MSTPTPPDVIEVIPVLKPDAAAGRGTAARFAQLRARLLRLRWPLLGLLLAAGAAGLAWWSPRARPQPLVGQVEAQEINVLAPAAGLLTRLHVQPGQQIEAGGALFELDAGPAPGTPVGSLGNPARPAALAAAVTGAASPWRPGQPVGGHLMRTAGSTAAWAGSTSVRLGDVALVADNGALTPGQASELAQARAELERSRVEVGRFERSAELAYAAHQRAIGLYEDSMIDSSARDAAQAQWKTADAQVRSARTRLEQARQRVATLLARLPAQAAVPAQRAPAQTGEPGPAVNQALPAAQATVPAGARGTGTGTGTDSAASGPAAGAAAATAPAAATAAAASAAGPGTAGAAAAGAGAAASAPAVAEGAGAPARAPAPLVGRLVLRAPVAGEINRIATQTGTRVTQGQWLMSILNLSDVWVVAVVREDVLPSYAWGSVHQGEVPVLRAQAEFKVESVTQLPDFATWRSAGGAELRSFEVRLRASSALPGLRPGMAVSFAAR
ncbi:MAG: hypothetical protein RLZZ584_3456 [Pseudomonadota bacterium]|jgi:HlyD family secretion protein